MKLKNIFFIILFLASCSTGIESGPKQITYNIKADIDLFLSTNDSDVEVQVLQRLKSQKVSHKAIKTLLRQRTKPIGEKRGLLTGLKFNSNGRDYSYALYYPETAPKTGPLPVVIVLHGMGGNSDVTAAKWAERLNREFIVIAPSYPMGAWWARQAEEIV